MIYKYAKQKEVTELNKWCLDKIESLKLVGTNEEVIYNEFTKLLDNKEEHSKMAKAVNPYGDRHACERIADILEGKEYQEWEN